MVAERLEPGAEAAHRDDLARDVARMWAGLRGPAWEIPELTERLVAALDRLAAAYGQPS